MNTLRFLVLCVFTVGVAFPAAAPSGTHPPHINVKPESFCGAAEAVHVDPLRHFASALARKSRLRIAAIGSSSTQGVGASTPGAAYPSQLHELLQAGLPGDVVEVINLGIGGEVAAQTAERLRREIPALSPDLVIWQVGTNDGITGVAAEAYEKTLRETLGFLKMRQTDTLLVGMQWTRKLAANPHYLELRDITARVAREQGVTLVSRFDVMRRLADISGGEELIGPDQLHMNDRGYRCLAEQVADAIARSVNGEPVASGEGKAIEGKATAGGEGKPIAAGEGKAIARHL